MNEVSEIEKAIEIIVRKILVTRSHHLIDELTDALGSLQKAKTYQDDGAK